MTKLDKPISRAERLKKLGQRQESRERGQETVETVLPTQGEGGEQVVEPGGGQVVIVTPQTSAVYDVKSETLKKIETILEEGLEDIFYSLTAPQQGMIKREGEHTARLVEEILSNAKATAVKIFNLIRHWLEFIPGVSKLFLEQEAKIKTDKILKIKGNSV